MADTDDKEMVAITRKRYEHLCERDTWLGCLEAAGVDNWNGFEVARKTLREYEQEYQDESFH